MDLAELQQLIRNSKPEDFVINNILSNDCPHFKPEQLEHVRKSIAEVTGINIKDNEIYVVGSAKLGFGLHQKTKRDGEILPAFRPFNADSDIDIAFASAELFDMVWQEVSTFAFSQTRFPARINKLGDYLVYGWLRPDHFPRDTRLLNYDRWNDKVRSLGRDQLLGRRKISGALYRNVEFVTKYQARGINTCKKLLELS
ncbi:hypothetical protein EXN22_18715 [Pseudomonas tructae]|uniref:Uncharacterized protein n=1 Tax=Pseudomonas tructae TaxID=2518644 RepID=A0A411MLH6_9PSED|nr:hypothetical protein [Pseudomonas tructae]QBF27620.1 hypothetical protein EXN22_18715 [Pseudomonas tructae]